MKQANITHFSWPRVLLVSHVRFFLKNARLAVIVDISRYFFLEYLRFIVFLDVFLNDVR